MWHNTQGDFCPIRKFESFDLTLQIKHARKARFVKLDMKVGHLVSYPNGAMQFENYRENEDKAESDARFAKRTLQKFSERSQSVDNLADREIMEKRATSLMDRSSVTDM